MEAFGRRLSQPAVSYTDIESGLTSVTAFFDSRAVFTSSLRRELAAEVRRIAACGLSIGPGRIVFQKVRSRDWAQSWKRHFQPFQVGSRLLVRPGWSRRQAGRNQRVVILNPGLSFGTGQHPTTRFCLEQLVRHRDSPRPRSCLDLGTGSGILAITAAKLGYSPVRALDFDPEAIAVAQANARRNQVEPKIEFKRQSINRLPLKSGRRFSVICANLLTPLLLSERGRILAQLEPNGLLVLAGILAVEFASVRAAYESAGLRLEASRAQQEWRSGAFRDGSDATSGPTNQPNPQLVIRARLSINP